MNRVQPARIYPRRERVASCHNLRKFKNGRIRYSLGVFCLIGSVLFVQLQYSSIAEMKGSFSISSITAEKILHDFLEPARLNNKVEEGNNGSLIDHFSTPRSPSKSSVIIAYAISITHCPRDNRSTSGIADGPAILAHSIHMNSVRHSASGSKYDYRLYAFVHPQARACARNLPELNYTVKILDTPINISLIKKEVYRMVVQNRSLGCCAEKEFLKLYSLTLNMHPIVVHFDYDVILLKPLDALFDAMLLPDGAEKHLGEHAMWPEDRVISRRIETFFTRDYPMGKPGWPRQHFGMQGGFWIVRPNRTAFEELRHLIFEGNYSFGWYDGTVHYKRFHGSANIQGLLGFYYSHISPGQMVELNRCLHNNMADSFHIKCASPLGVQCSEDCRKTNFSKIYSFHATFCRKPWSCLNFYKNRLRGEICSRFMEAWFQIRYHLETVGWGRSLDPVSLQGDRSFGYCAEKGQYRPIHLDNKAVVYKQHRTIN